MKLSITPDYAAAGGQDLGQCDGLVSQMGHTDFASAAVLGSLPGRGRSSRASIGPTATARSTQRWTV